MLGPKALTLAMEKYKNDQSCWAAVQWDLKWDEGMKERPFRTVRGRSPS